MQKFGRVFGYNKDGSIHNKEAETVKYVFDATNRYYENPPAELFEWANEELEGVDPLHTEEEIVEKARLMVNRYVAEEVSNKFYG